MPFSMLLLLLTVTILGYIPSAMASEEQSDLLADLSLSSQEIVGNMNDEEPQYLYRQLHRKRKWSMVLERLFVLVF